MRNERERLALAIEQAASVSLIQAEGDGWLTDEQCALIVSALRESKALELRVEHQPARNSDDVLAGPDCGNAVSEGNQADHPAPPAHTALGDF